MALNKNMGLLSDLKKTKEKKYPKREHHHYG